MRFHVCRVLSRLSVGVCLVGVTATAGAQEEKPASPLQVEEVVVTATRTEVPLSQAASSVTVIDGKTMEERHITTVSEALREVPGVDSVQSGGPGGVTSAFLRGAESRHTLVLIDGVQVNSTTDGRFDFADLTTENIERIEIIRGPQSTLYGSDSVGGVIHIITRKGKGGPVSSASFEGGSFRSFREALSLSGSTDRVNYSVSLSRVDTGGFSRAREQAGNSFDDDGYENTTVSSRIGVLLSQRWQIEGAARFTTSQAEIDAGAFADDPNRVQDNRSVVGTLRLIGSLAGWWGQQLALSLNQENLEGRDPDSPFGNFTIDTGGRRIDWQHTFHLGQWGLLTGGYEHERQTGDTGGISQRLSNNAGYLLGQVTAEPVIVNIGGRFDHNNRFGDKTTFKIEGASFLGSLTKIRAAYGTGFRGPTLADLFFPGFGNPDLRPETSHSWDLGVEIGNRMARLGTTYFHTSFKDLIVFDPSTFTPQNIQRARSQGIEAELHVSPQDRVELSLGYTWTDTKNRVTGSRLLRRPRHKGNGTLTLTPFSPIRLTLDLRYVSSRLDSGGVSVGGYTVVNVGGTYQFSPQMEVFVKIDNLFDKEYEEVSGFGTAGLSARGGVTVTF